MKKLIAIIATAIAILGLAFLIAHAAPTSTTVQNLFITGLKSSPTAGLTIDANGLVATGTVGSGVSSTTLNGLTNASFTLQGAGGLVVSTSGVNVLTFTQAGGGGSSTVIYQGYGITLTPNPINNTGTAALNTSTLTTFINAFNFLTGVTANSPLSGSGTAGSPLTFTNPGYASSSITITGGGILSGGGDLTANRIISLSTSTLWTYFGTSSPIQFNPSTGVISCPTCYTGSIPATSTITANGTATGNAFTFSTSGPLFADITGSGAAVTFKSISTSTLAGYLNLSQYITTSSVSINGVQGNVFTSLATSSGITAGSCTNCNLTYNANGVITVAGNGTGGSGGSLSTSSPITVNNFPFWTSIGGALSGTSTLTVSGNNLFAGGAFNASGTITQNGVAVSTATNTLSLFNGNGFITTSTFNSTGTASALTAWNASGNGLTSYAGATNPCSANQVPTTISASGVLGGCVAVNTPSTTIPTAYLTSINGDTTAAQKITVSGGLLTSSTAAGVTTIGLSTSTLNTNVAALGYVTSTSGGGVTSIASGTNISASAATGSVTINFVNPGFVTAASSVTWTAPQTFNATATFASSVVLSSLSSTILAVDGNGKIVATTTVAGSASGTINSAASNDVAVYAASTTVTGTSSFTYASGNATATLQLGTSSSAGCIQMIDTVNSSTYNKLVWNGGILFMIPSSTCQ